jgi:hypothetical protein
VIISGSFDKFETLHRRQSSFMSDSKQQAKDFEQQAASSTPSMFGEIMAFLGQTKKWWLAPIVMLLLLIAVFVALAATGAAPFIYTLF